MEGETFSIISLVLNLLLGGTLIVTLVTLKSTKDKAEFEAKNTEVDYAKNMMETQLNFIVKPLENKVEKLTKEMRKLRMAINRVADCPYEEQCPVRLEIKKQEEKEENL